MTVVNGTPGSARGFTLLEIVVAVAILGVAVGTAMQIFSGGLKNVRKIDLAHRAMNHAENIMNRLLSDEEIRQPLELSGDLDEEFRYLAVVDEWQETRQQGNLEIPINQPLNVRLLSVRVDVYFKNDRNRKFYRTVSMKTVSDQPFPTAPSSPGEAIRQLFGARQ